VAAVGAHGVRRLLARGTVMGQERRHEVFDDGEWSLAFLDGGYSHAMRKRPGEGVFRVEEERGGSTVGATADAALIEAAARALAPVAGRWLYARVDGVVTARGFRLMELEMLEPSLFLVRSPDAPARFADAIAHVLND
jgi:hypothetical protein